MKLRDIPEINALIKSEDGSDMLTFSHNATGVTIDMVVGVSNSGSLIKMWQNLRLFPFYYIHLVHNAHFVGRSGISILKFPQWFRS